MPSRPSSFSRHGLRSLMSKNTTRWGLGEFLSLGKMMMAPPCSRQNSRPEPSGAVSSQSGRVVSRPFQTGFKPTLGSSATAATKPITSDIPTEKKRDCMGGVNLLKSPKSINGQKR